jgi:hypothetical protein
VYNTYDGNYIDTTIALPQDFLPMGVAMDLNDRYSTIKNNIITNVDKGIRLYYDSNDSIIQNNTFYNITKNNDVYNLAIMLDHCSNISIKNNYISYYTTGILFHNSPVSNINITGNIFVENRTLNPLLYQWGEIPCALNIGQQYEGFERDYSSPASEVYYYNNSFSSSTQCYLRNQNNNTITNDLTNVWYIKHNVFNSTFFPEELFLNNNFPNITTVNYNGTSIPPKYYVGILTNLLFSSFNPTYMTNYSLSKTYYYYKNDLAYSNIIALFNISSSSLVTYSKINGVIINGNINITLDSNGEAYVFNNFDRLGSIPLLQTIYTTDQIKQIYPSAGLVYPTIATNDSLTRNILSIVAGFIALLILAVVFASFMIYIVKSKGLQFFNSMDAYDVITVGIVALVCIILGGALISYIYQLM